MQSVRKQDFASASTRETMRGNVKPVGVSKAGNNPFVRAPFQPGNIDKTTLQSRTIQAMNNLALVRMNKEGMAIAESCRGLPPGTERDLHTSVNPYVREYAAGLAATTNTRGPLFMKFDDGMMSIHSRSAEDSYPLFSMHPTSGGIGYMVQDRPLNASSSLPEIEMGRSHLSLCRLVAEEAVDPRAARLAVEADQA